MTNQNPRSFKPLTISAEQLPASMGRHDVLTSYAAERAKLLLGCYRTGEANDPVTYVAAITAVLARYPEHVITTVTHPATGLPKKSSWLPTIKEVFDACEAAVLYDVNNEARLKRIKEQLETREQDENRREERLTLAELKAKYGPNWGLNVEPSFATRPAKKAPSWDQIIAHYQFDPGRIESLLKRDE